MSSNSAISNDKTTIRSYQGKRKSDIVNFPLSLRRDFLSPAIDKSVLNMPISAHRILFKILNDVSYDQFSPTKQPSQLSLFEKDFKTEHNTYAHFTFSISEISDYYDYSNIKKGLEFLENFQKNWYKSTNSKGKTIRSYGGLISNANISEGKVTFLVSAYWMEKLTTLSAYNKVYYEIPWILSKSKHILFYLWLLELGEKGTQINFHKFQESFEYNFKTPSAFAKNFLKIIKSKLDVNANKSFNYSVKGDTIKIVPYFTKNVELKLQQKTINRQAITQKLHYWKVRHELHKNDIDVLKSIINMSMGEFKLLLQSYELIVSNCRKNKIKVTTYKGEAFLKLFQDAIVKVYSNSMWSKKMPNGYPTIV